MNAPSCQPNELARRRRRRVSVCGLILGVLLVGGCSGIQAGSDSGPSEGIGSDKQFLQFLDGLEGKSLEQKQQEVSGYRFMNGNALAKQKSAYILARILKKNGTTDNLKQAVPLFEEAAQIPALWERCQWHISEAANTLGNEKLVRQSLNNLIEKSTDAKVKAQAEYSLAQSYLRANEKDKAKEQFEKVLSKAPTSQYALGAGYYLGGMLLAGAEKAEALSLWRQYLDKSPDGRFALDIVGDTAAFSGALVPADHARFAEVYFAHGQWERALKEWQLSGQSSAWLKISTCLMRTGKTNLAKAFLLSKLKTQGSGKDVPEAAKILAKLGSKDDAVGIWKLVLSNCPHFADLALYNLALRAPEAQALGYYAQIANRYPHSDYAPESSWWLIFDQIKKGKSQVALAQCKSAAKKYAGAKSGSRFSFWIGKLYERLKQREAAKAAYQQTVAGFGKHYYGWRAHSRLEALSGGRDRGWSTNAQGHLRLYQPYLNDRWKWPEPPHLMSYQSIEAQSDATISTLAELHQWDECYELLPEDKLPELRSLCLAKLNLPLEAINVAAKFLEGMPDSEPRWQLGYPLLHAASISSEAAVKKVDPLLAQALIREESRYNIYAISSSKAIGLMQLLPATAYGVAKRLNLNVNRTEDIYRPENNIKLGVDYLSYTLGRFKGNAMFAVASYNGGPNAVARWSKQYGLADPDLFVECIPYSETRDYVRKVFGSFWNYEAIYARRNG